MLQVDFTVPGQPRGKGRPRFARRGNFVTTYTDAKTSSYEDQIRFYALRAMGGNKPLTTALEAFIHVRLPMPQSYSKKRTEACLSGLERPCKKPDLDNIIKAMMDGMNEVIYDDDVQIVSITATKLYAAKAEVYILIKEIL